MIIIKKPASEATDDSTNHTVTYEEIKAISRRSHRIPSIGDSDTM